MRYRDLKGCTIGWFKFPQHNFVALDFVFYMIIISYFDATLDDFVFWWYRLWVPVQLSSFYQPDILNLLQFRTRMSGSLIFGFWCLKLAVLALHLLFRSRAKMIERKLSLCSRLRIYLAVLGPILTYRCEARSLAKIPQSCGLWKQGAEKNPGTENSTIIDYLLIWSIGEIWDFFTTSVFSSKMFQWAGHVPYTFPDTYPRFIGGSVLKLGKNFFYIKLM